MSKKEFAENKKAILSGVAQHLNGLLRKKQGRIRKDTQTLIDKHLRADDTFQFLQSREGVKEYGLNMVNTRLDAVVKAIQESVTLTIKPFTIKSRGLSRGGLKIQLVNIQQLLSLNPAIIHTRKGEEWEWLRLLLVSGPITLIDWYYEPDPTPSEQKYSRAGGIMRGGHRTGKRYTPSHYGTTNDNFVIRSLTTKDFQSDLQEEITEWLKADFN